MGPDSKPLKITILGEFQGHVTGAFLFFYFFEKSQATSSTNLLWILVKKKDISSHFYGCQANEMLMFPIGNIGWKWVNKLLVFLMKFELET